MKTAYARTITPNSQLQSIMNTTPRINTQKLVQAVLTTVCATSTGLLCAIDMAPAQAFDESNALNIFGDIIKHSITTEARRNNNNNRNNPVVSSSTADRQLLQSQGLVPVDCGPGVVEVRFDRSELMCAVPTSQYPAGRYYLTEDFSIRRSGQTTPAQQSSPFQTTGQQGFPAPFPASTPPLQPVFPTSPTFSNSPVLLINNPSQPLPATITAQITAALQGKGLAPASCSTNPGVVVEFGAQYMACAYPNATYPAGRYSFR